MHPFIRTATAATSSCTSRVPSNLHGPQSTYITKPLGLQQHRATNLRRRRRILHEGAQAAVGRWEHVSHAGNKHKASQGYRNSPPVYDRRDTNTPLLLVAFPSSQTSL